MAKPLVAPAIPIRRFRPLLPSRPVPLPFAGDYGAVSVVYDVAAVMGLPDKRQDLMADLISREKEIAAERAAWYAAVLDESAERPPTEAEQAQVRAWDQEGTQLVQQARLRLIAHVVVGLVWPFDEPPAPDPAQPESFLLFPSPVLTWLAGDGLAEAEAQLRDPTEDADPKLDSPPGPP